MSAINVIQITDVHLVAEASGQLCDVRTQETLERTLEAALAGGLPDALVVTGDIAHDPVESVYRRFLQTVREQFDGALACTPGNHDVVAPMRAAGLPMAHLDFGSWQLRVLDSHVDDTLAASVSDAQVASLLEGADRHTVVATHHHLFDVGCPWLDKDRIHSPALLDALPRRAGSRVVLSGHVHQASQRDDRGTRFMTAPSTCFQFQPGSPVPTLNGEPPGWRRLRLEANGAFSVEVGRVDGLQLNPRFS